jgi:hypothetical protein
MGGTGGIGAPPICLIDSYGNCMYPGGSQCTSTGYCCTRSADRCCDATGRCSAPLPPPPPWVPPVAAADVGAAGWKNSTDPLCVKNQSYNYLMSVWSDSRGVFVATVTSGPDGSAMQPYDPMCPGCSQEPIYFNGGDGWELVAGTPYYGQQKMKGFEGGALVLYGSTQQVKMPNALCGLSLLSNGMFACEPVDGVSDVATVSSTLAYAVLQGDLVRYDGSHWGPLTAVLPGQHELMSVWADATVAMATGSSAGKIYTLRDNAWKLEDTRTLDTFTSIWGFSPTDVWAGTQQEHLFHYDGNMWQQVSWPGSGCSQVSGISSMWGSGSVLYFATPTSLARWNGTKVDVLTQWDCNDPQGAPTISGLYGNSPADVFVGIADGRPPMQPCGMTYVLYYDGTKFHRI